MLAGRCRSEDLDGLALAGITVMLLCRRDLGRRGLVSRGGRDIVGVGD